MANFIQYKDENGKTHTIAIPRAVDNLESTSAVLPLSANQGRILKERIEALELIISNMTVANIIEQIPMACAETPGLIRMQETYIDEETSKLSIWNTKPDIIEESDE